MRGGYLTLDFSDVELKEGNSINWFKLGSIKGIRKYVENTDKPIYVILSSSVMNAIAKYCLGNSAIPINNKCTIQLQHILTENNDSVTSRYFIIYSKYYDTVSTGIDIIQTPSLAFNFMEDDSVVINEI